MRVFLIGPLFLSLPAFAQEAPPDQLFQRAVDEQQRGDFTSAIADYRRLLEVRPADVQATVNLGAALTHVGKYDDAIDTYRSALPLVKDKGPVLLNLALAYYKKNDFENARQQFEVLRDSRPDDIRVL